MIFAGAGKRWPTVGRLYTFDMISPDYSSDGPFWVGERSLTY
jgi:hypothetical protein